LRCRQVNLSTSFERAVKREGPARTDRAARLAGAAAAAAGRVTIACLTTDLEAVRAAVLSALEGAVVERVVTGVPARLADRLRADAAGRGVEVRASASGAELIVRGARGLVAACEAEMLRAIVQAGGAAAAADCWPSGWAPMAESVNLLLVDVAKGSAEMRAVDDKVRATVPSARVVALQRVQNRWLWEAYAFQRGRMAARGGAAAATELELFHGTKGNSPRLIYDGQTGFDPRFARPGMWGKGCYFAASAAYSHAGYAYEAGAVAGAAGCKQLLLATVLVGSAVRLPGDQTLTIPPERPQTGAGAAVGRFAVDRYDSVVGHTGGSDVYIIYDTCGRAYPLYVVTYVA
jgi:hypothetical protein